MEPLPFRLSPSGRDTMGLEGIESVSFRVDGLLHLTADGLRFEWDETRTSERFSLERTGTDVEHYALEPLDLPFDRIAGAWVIGGWWWPRLELRARALEDWEGVPGARGVTLVLRLARRDRALAEAIASQITRRITDETPSRA